MRHRIIRATTVVYLLLAGSICSCGQKLEEVRINHPNGQLKIKGTMLNGKKHGQSETYYDNGQTQTRNNWRDGVQVGATKRWHRNGRINFTGQFENGQESGEWKYYDDVDGKQLFSVTNQGGAIISIKYSGEKYKWRKVDIDRIAVSMEFPLPIDSTEKADELDGFWAMFPFTSKKDFEYYGLADLPIEMSLDQIDSEVAGAPERRLNFLRQVFGDNDPNSSTPNILGDEFGVLSAKKDYIGDYPAYHMLLKSSTLSVFLESWLIPVEEDGNVFLIFSYYHENVDRAAPTRFFNSFRLLD